MTNYYLSGKYTKLNRVQKLIKNWANEEPYQGKYSNGPDLLADAFAASDSFAQDNLEDDLNNTVLGLIGQLIF